MLRERYKTYAKRRDRYNMTIYQIIKNRIYKLTMLYANVYANV